MRERKGGRMSNDIYRRQSLVSVSSGGSQAHLSVFFFFKSTLCFQLIVFRSLFSTITPSLRLGYCQPAGQFRRESASAAASSVPALHTDCVYWVNTKFFTVRALVLLSRTRDRLLLKSINFITQV